MEKTVTTSIDEALCNGCGICAEICPLDTITMRENKAVVTGNESLNCGHCFAACPTGAVSVSALDPSLSSFRHFKPVESWLPFGHGSIEDLVHVMQSRRSCRNFKEKPVQRDLLEDLVKIGITAPSGSNSQRWSFTILPDRDAVFRLAEQVGAFYTKMNRIARKAWLRKAMKLFGKPELERYYQDYYQSVREGLDKWKNEGKDILFHGAPAAILAGSRAGASCPAEDALLATQNILLGAHVLGLGTCLIGFAVEAVKRERGILRKFGIPDDERIYSIIAIGYPAEKYFRLSGRREVLLRYSAGA
jgi:nitroreductase/Pyruvate/2-oxoacid:ferredoxin oxidoreductase delta subunit